jgi:hypothetical protein
MYYYSLQIKMGFKTKKTKKISVTNGVELAFNKIKIDGTQEGLVSGSCGHRNEPRGSELSDWRLAA